MKTYLYIEAKEKILNLITSGTFKFNERIWNERTLASKLGYSRTTIKNAINSLVADNILEKRRGDGTYLVEVISTDNLVKIGDDAPNSFTQIMRINKRNTNSRVWSFKAIYHSAKLKLIFGNQYEDFYELIRTRMVAQQVIAFQKSYIPFREFEDAHRYDFGKLSLYDYMDFRNKKPIVFHTIFQAQPVEKDSFIAKQLNLEAERYLLYFEYQGFTKRKKLVEYTQSWYHPNFINYKNTIKR